MRHVQFMEILGDVITATKELVEYISAGKERYLRKMGKENLEQEVNHPDKGMVQCNYLRCKKRGKFVNCYFAFEQCRTYQRWEDAIRIYTNRALQRRYLKEKNKGG